MKKTCLLTLSFSMFLFLSANAYYLPEDEHATDTLELDEMRERDIPILTISIDDLEGDGESHDISSLLQGSRDIYVNTAGFNFGSARYRIRGYDSENTTVMINHIPVNDPETGRAFFSVWGGLNDVTRMTEPVYGIGASRHTFGGVGGATNIVTRASRFGPNTRTTYSNANRTYNHRMMFTHSTGMQDNGWAFTLSGSRRSATEGYAPGTFYDAWGYFLSTERQLNREHSIGLIAFGAPSRTGRPGVAVQEAYDLTGNNFYNPNWGFQNGEKRNARVNNFHTPWVILSHYWTPGDQTEITTSAAYSFGRGGSTALNWYDSHKSFDHPNYNLAGDPRPDYYRWLPSFHSNNPQMFNLLTNLWQNDENFSQIDWDWFYNANRRNLFTAENVDGIEGNNVTGMRSKYILEERRNDRTQLVFNSNIEHMLDPTHILSGGINVSMSKTHQFKTIDDLLGGDWFFDIDQFAERDFDDPMMAQPDLNNPNRIVREGDVFGYDFTGNINEYSIFAQSEWILPRWDFHVAGKLSHTTFWRTGHMRNARFPDNSYGDGEKHNFTNFGLKGGATFKITGRQYVVANAAAMTRAPYFRDAYISSRVRDDVIDGLGNETIFSGDLNYFIRSPFIKSRLTVFYTEFRDQTWSRSFYHDELRTFVNYIMTGVDTRHMGVELGIDLALTPTISSYIVAGTGDYIYNSRPEVTIARDNDSEIMADGRKVFLQNYKLGGMTHTAGSVGLRYDSPRFWFVGVNANFFDDIYIDINPDRRTEAAVQHLVETDPQWRQLLDQEKMDHNFTFDAYFGRSWRIQRQYFINFNISVSNITDVTDFRIGGFEQLRYDSHQPERFDSKYFYLYGRTYFANLVLRF
ncbi:MAG: TonB-dependent receptor [Bacteroidia bacterium]|nr:MAG: TonB-dependent receptor [Bacteroidia bacterium]